MLTTMERIASDRAAQRMRDAVWLFFLFLLGSVAGYVIETLYFLLATGEYLYRGSLIWGPVNTVYGAGALVLYGALRGRWRAGWHHVFLVGALTGTATEFALSWLQEAALGSVSWDYAGMPLNLGGRVWIGSALCWGALSLAWAYLLQPGLEWIMAHVIECPIALPLAACLFALLLLDAALSLAAVSRWALRMEGAPAIGWLAQSIDQLFPNAVMEQIYESMRFCIGS